MPSENVSVTEGLSVEVSVPPVEGFVADHIVAAPPVDPEVPPRVVTPEEAREKALSGIPVEGQPISGSGR